MIVDTSALVAILFGEGDGELLLEALVASSSAKISGHSAQLNLGDAFAYALHRSTGEPMLFKGKDFSAAGVESASVD